MINFTPLTGSECPADLNALLTLFASHLQLPVGVNNVVFSESPPAADGTTLWYQPSTNTLNVYVNGGWKAVSGGIWRVGDIVMFDAVVDLDPTMASPDHPERQPWALCDGNTYSGIATPNLTDRFARGGLSGFGTEAGANTAVLALANIPSHKHAVPATIPGTGSGSVNNSIGGSGSIDTSFSCGHGTTFGSETPADPSVAPDPVAILPAYTVVGFKKYIGFP